MPPIAVPVPPEMRSVPPLNPPLTPPANDMLSAVSAWVIEDVVPVVLPIAERPIEVAEAAIVEAEITTLLPLIPTLTAPAPSKLSDPAAITPELADVVVLPTAKMLSPAAVCAAVDAEMTTLDPEMPIETMPAPSKLNDPVPATPEDTEVVVFPTAKSEIVGPV